MIRIAAVGDVHYDRNPRERMRAHLAALQEKADLLLIAGDLTQSGAVEEAEALASDLKSSPVPVISVLGNHDFHRNQEGEIRELLRDSGVILLEGNSVEFNFGGKTIGITGMKGFGGGFFGACVTEFGEPQTKAFARHCREQAELLHHNMKALHTDFKFVLLHYSPIEPTLLGEKKEIYPFLGSYLLGEAIDANGADAVFHGHAHFGTEKGATPGGVPVRNVAQMVIRHSYNIYTFETPVLSRPQERLSEYLLAR